jgi:hypothetical protein
MMSNLANLIAGSAGASASAVVPITSDTPRGYMLIALKAGEARE